jgi:DNA ligase-associated metallophosphoesterase
MIESRGDLEVQVGGETLVLLPERAAFWPAQEMLLLADPHFGKAAAFRAFGIPVPSGTTGDALHRLGATVDRTRATKVVFLGDLLHSRQGRSKAVFDAFAEWKSVRGEVRLTLVRGNHDRHAGDPPAELDIGCVDSPLRFGPFVLAHHPVTSVDGYVLAGHVHPCVRLYGPGRQGVRLPCFSFGQSVGILPAFGDFTGCSREDPDPAADVYAVADGCVISVTG